MHDPEPRWTFEAAVDESVYADWLARLARRFPPAAAATIADAWAGLYDMTPDAHPIIGPVADGVYAVCGFSGHGFMQSPAVGRAVAEEIVRGQASLDLRSVSSRALRAGRRVPRASRALAARPGEHGHERDEGEIAREQVPRPRRRVLEGERPVAAGEPCQREPERRDEQRRADSPRRPRTSGTNGTSQIRNCGEKTLPNATSAATVAAEASSSVSPVGRLPAREGDPDRRAARGPRHGGRPRRPGRRRAGERLRAVARHGRRRAGAPRCSSRDQQGGSRGSRSGAAGRAAP